MNNPGISLGLEELDLSFNNLQVIQTTVLEGLKKLRKLNISNNHIHSIIQVDVFWIKCGQKMMYAFVIWPTMVKVYMSFWPHFLFSYWSKWVQFWHLTSFYYIFKIFNFTNAKIFIKPQKLLELKSVDPRHGYPVQKCTHSNGIGLMNSTIISLSPKDRTVN